MSDTHAQRRGRIELAYQRPSESLLLLVLLLVELDRVSCRLEGAKARVRFAQTLAVNNHSATLLPVRYNSVLVCVLVGLEARCSETIKTAPVS